ncbi:MAG: hypothetical protein ACRECW_11070 [Phyllobacterium sp.]
MATPPAERSPTGKRITIAAAATMRENACSDWSAERPNRAEELTKTMAVRLAPGNPPPFR